MKNDRDFALRKKYKLGWGVEGRGRRWARTSQIEAAALVKIWPPEGMWHVPECSPCLQLRVLQEPQWEVRQEEQVDDALKKDSRKRL